MENVRGQSFKKNLPVLINECLHFSVEHSFYNVCTYIEDVCDTLHIHWRMSADFPDDKT